jgi:hypothetical protein
MTTQEGVCSDGIPNYLNPIVIAYYWKGDAFVLLLIL